MKRIDGAALPNGIDRSLQHGEEIRVVATPKYATPRPGQHWNASLVLTSHRLIVSKERLFGKAKIDYDVPWSLVEGVEGQLWKGGGPDIQLIVRTTQGALELIVPPLHAVEVESAIRDGYIG
ncbi:MAG: hypothetical protein AAGC46_00880 [Solirubrobacteraceae bacterium]|nr:hypothetical protein [Patulibacter sp.]